MSARTHPSAQDGYAMVALLVGLAVMGVMLSLAMPVWKTMVQREKEEELVFRGQQYARAIGLFQRKYANAYPPNLEILTEQRFLRKKYTDPMVKGEKGGEGEFQVLYQTEQRQRPVQAPGGPGGPGGRAGAIGGVSGGSQLSGGLGQASGPGAPASGPASGPAAGPRGGIVGVTSKSKVKSLRVYNGRTAYNEWQFLWTAEANNPGSAARPGGNAGPQPQHQGRPATGASPGRGATSAFDPRR